MQLEIRITDFHIFAAVNGKPFAVATRLTDGKWQLNFREGDKEHIMADDTNAVRLIMFKARGGNGDAYKGSR
jgi:hypothetical protein